MEVYSVEGLIRKPTVRRKAPARRLLGVAAVGARMSGLRRHYEQSQRLGGYWTVIRGKSVFVRTSSARRPVDAKAKLSRMLDLQKKRALGLRR